MGRVSVYINLTQFSRNPFIIIYSLLLFSVLKSQHKKRKRKETYVKNRKRKEKKRIWINILGLVNINYKCKYYVRIFYYYFFFVFLLCLLKFLVSILQAFHFNANTDGTCLFFVLTSVAFFLFHSSPCFFIF